MSGRVDVLGLGLSHHLDVDEDWLANGSLLHPGFGLVPYQGEELPFDERDLPAAFNALSEQVRDQREETVVQLAWAWAGEHGANGVEADLMGSDWGFAAAAGLQQSTSSRSRWVGPLTTASGQVQELLRTNPERLWVRAGEELRLYVHETWTSPMIVWGEPATVERLRTALDVLRSAWV